MDLRDSLVASSEIRSFCQEHYGRDPIISAGYNARRPPQEEDLPIIVLIPEGSTFSAVEKREHSIVITWSVLSPEVDIEENRRTYKGFLEADELGELIYESLEVIGDQYKLSSTGYDLAGSELMPSFLGEMKITIEEW